ncbi:recombinase family protein [Bacillus sp. UNC438CL73TsuS30]|uniref:recombinase family protein n=1 Tax=Bacillus sp. UNC438CL73TsuS30 TaxID=1340434 RepID=UPI00068A2FD5|nr:recombinase family protein [Bacillus sp. UNC438CL73TsuS30]
MLRVGAYARVSTGREEQDTSLVNQKLMFENYIQGKGWVFEKYYQDRKTGTKAKRPELIKLLNDIEQKNIEVVLVKDLSRLARNGELSYKIFNLAKATGVHIISLDGMVNTMENNMDMLGLLAWMYEKESQNLSQKIKSVKEVGASTGRYQGSTPPYGYYLKDGKLYIRKDETPSIVKRIFQEYTNGTGVDTIAKYLTLEGVPTPAQVINKKNAGTEWMSNTIKTILSNPHYTGNLVQCRTTTISVVSTKRKSVDRDEQKIVKGTHEPIIMKDVFETAQKQMMQRKKNLTAPKAHLFTNVAFCADCGRGMWFRSDRKGYICGLYGRYGNEKCSSHTIKEDKLTNAIIQDFGEFFKGVNLGMLSKHFQQKIEKSFKKSTRELEKIESKIKMLEKRKLNYIQMRADGDLTAEEFKTSNTINNKELEDLQTQKASLEANACNHKIDLDCIKEDFLQYLYTPEILPELIHRFISRIEIEKDGTPRIYYNFHAPRNQYIA